MKEPGKHLRMLPGNGKHFGPMVFRSYAVEQIDIYFEKGRKQPYVIARMEANISWNPKVTNNFVFAKTPGDSITGAFRKAEWFSRKLIAHAQAWLAKKAQERRLKSKVPNWNDVFDDKVRISRTTAEQFTEKTQDNDVVIDITRPCYPGTGVWIDQDNTKAEDQKP